MRISDWSSDVCSSDLATIYYDRTQFPAQLVKDYPGLNSPILQHGRCSLIVSTPGSNTGTYYFCTYALTANDLYVDRKSVVQGKSVSVRVDLGGRSIVKKKRQR